MKMMDKVFGSASAVRSGCPLKSGVMRRGVYYATPSWARGEPRRDTGLWPTPQAFDATNIKRSKEALARAKKKGGCRNLREEVFQWPSLGTDGKPQRALAVRKYKSGALNPTWVEWLLGYPPFWTLL